MLKFKGIFGIGTILKLGLALFVASTIISLSTIGDFGTAMSETLGMMDETDFTVEVEDADTMNQLYLFVRDRSVDQGCEVIEEEIHQGETDERPYDDWDDWGGGYPALADTRLGQFPDCHGTEAGAMRDPAQAIGGRALQGFVGSDVTEENHMPGILSRERFEVTGNFSIDKGRNKYMLDEQIGFVSDVMGEEPEEGEVREVTGRFPPAAAAIAAGAKAVVGHATRRGAWVTAGSLWAAWRAPKAIGNIFYDTEVEHVIIYNLDPDVSLENRSNIEPLTREGIFQEDWDDEELEIEKGSEIEVAVQTMAEGIEQEFWFCEGDEGFIQASRGSPDNMMPSDEGPLYPIIVIEEAEQQTCDEGDLQSLEEFEGNDVGKHLVVSTPTEDHFDTTGDVYIPDVGLNPTDDLSEEDFRWPWTRMFRLKEEEDHEWFGHGSHKDDNWPDDGTKTHLCQITWYEDDDGLIRDNSGMTVRNFDRGTEIESRHDDWAHRGGDGGLPYRGDQSFHRDPTASGEEDARDLIGDMSNVSGIPLGGQSMPPLAVDRTEDGLRKNWDVGVVTHEMYGDLMCGNSNEAEGAWHLCHQGMEGEEIETRRGIYQCDEGGEWDLIDCRNGYDLVDGECVLEGWTPIQ